MISIDIFGIFNKYFLKDKKILSLFLHKLSLIHTISKILHD